MTSKKGTPLDLFDALGDAVRNQFASQRGALPRALFYSPDAARRMADLLAARLSTRSVMLLADARTWAAAGEPCEQALRIAGFSITRHILSEDPGGAGVVCDDATQDRLKRVFPDAGVWVAVGSGVVNDLAKWCAAESGVPYAVYATAASMNGYSAANVAPTVRGVKTLFAARAPLAIAADPAVIEGAPFELTASGLGDVIAKPVSTADWLVNHRLFGESYSPAIAQIIDRIEATYLDVPVQLARRVPAAIQALFEALVFSGCAMTLQGSSLPASGGEHLVSHTLDMLSHLDGTPHDLHGRQVGVATIFAAAVYERIFAIGEPIIRLAVAPFDPALWRSIAGAVEVEHAKKKKNVEAACRALAAPGCWEGIASDVRPILRSPAKIKECLASAGAAHRLVDIGVSRERFLTAVAHSGAIRGRFTSIDLGLVTGVLPDASEAIVDEWLA